MYRNFSPQLLGISSRQSEQIETALTYRYQGLELAIDELCRTAQERGWPHATRFLPGKQLQFSGKLPIGWTQEEPEFRQALDQLAAWAPELAKIGATRLFAVVEPGSQVRPYHENFELHRTRFMQIGDLLAPHGIQLAVGMDATLVARQPFHYQFIGQADALLTLLKTIGLPSVGLLLDSWHWQVGGGTLDLLRQLPLEQIVAVVLADLPADYDPGTVTTSARLWATQTGTVPNTEIYAYLREGGYGGPISLSVASEQLQGWKRHEILPHAQRIMTHLERGDTGPLEQDSPAIAAPQ